MTAPLRNCALAITLAAIPATAAWPHIVDLTKPEGPRGTLIRMDIKLEKPKNKGHGKPDKSIVSAVVVTDLAGKIIGRYWERNALLNYEDGLLPLPLAYETRIDPATKRIQTTGYFTWGGGSLYFTTPNCTGTPHGILSYYVGTKYISVSAKESATNGWTAYVFNREQGQLMTMYSSATYDSSTNMLNCWLLGEGFTEFFAPAIDSFPLEEIGSPPLKIQ